jgi:hypothetical protein
MPYASLLNPQTLNLYTYVENDPLSKFDADGHQSRQSPLPGNSRYKIRIDRNNPNDAPNIHVFDKGGRREIGRVAIKPEGNEWTGKVPESVKAQVEALAREKGIEPRLPQGRANAEPPTPRQRGRGGLRGGSAVLTGLSVLGMILDAINQHSDAKNLGYYTSFSGRLVITDLDKAAKSLGEGAKIEVSHPVYFPGRPAVFVVEKGKFVTQDPRCKGCELHKDNDGKIAVGKLM